MSVSVYFSGESIRIAEGTSKKKSVTANKLISVPMPADAMINGVVTNDIEIKELLPKIWAEHKLPKSDIRIVIDSSSILLKVLTVPLTSENNIISIIKREFAEVENFEDMLFDYTVHKPVLEEGGGQILAFAAEKIFIGSYIELFDNVKGAKITRITAAQDSTVKFMRSCKSAEGKTYITAVIDGNILSLSLFSENEYKFSNRSRLLAEKGTPEYADEIAYAISSIIQFNRAEISDIYFFGLGEEERITLNNINLLLEKQNSVFFPYLNEMVSFKNKPVGTNDLTEFVYCIGTL